MCCHEKSGCQYPEKLKEKPEECSPEQITECRGDPPRIHLHVFAAILALVIFVAAMGILFSKKIEAESQEKTVKGSEERQRF